ncbi:hypothetical protein OGAPHI_007046 [Ogataea philodendri]|uniref:Catabolite repression protein creC n=1 Tax=Ogataea philodendri TaxID=1378263 RepID=A0A9P8NVU7_9ASCO|nr:uncharacterized protein OGAPHI_007046 [Ogataea philodendri]KAH3660460.1 hypothetical protein OGAPHI_007046 [Ogataea philodendri]
MYLPADLSRFNKLPNNQFQNVLSNSILPIQSTDPNCLFRLNEEQFSFEHLDGTFKPDTAIRISRTPLISSDPSTYASLSKFVEQNLRKYHTTLGNINQNQLTNPLSLPPEPTGVQPDGKTEVLPIGYGINPLIADPFKNVHLTPGCLADVINFDDQKQKPHDYKLSNPNSVRLWTKPKSLKNDINPSSEDLKVPKSSLVRSTSNFIAKVLTADGFNRKFSNSESVLLACHGRVLNLITLADDAKEIDAEIPLLKVVFSTGIITAMSHIHYVTTSGETALDVLIAFASGDIFWLNIPKLKYSRWNKNAKLKNKPVISLQWSNCGNFATVGFGDGEVMIFHRDFEDSEVYKVEERNAEKLKNISVLHSLKSSPSSTFSNPIAHYKFSSKAITGLNCHPEFSNIWAVACDDGFVRIFDMFAEHITDLVSSYYGGVLDVLFTRDGKYLLTGGEDDIVSVFEFTNVGLSNTSNGLIKLVVRLEGSRSWVRAINVDLFKTTSGLLYRIGTAGDDGSIRFYEFQPRNLPKIRKLKARGKPLINQRQKSSLTLNSQSEVSFKQSIAASETMRRSWLQGSKFESQTGSVSSLTSLNRLQHLSLYEIINQDKVENMKKHEDSNTQGTNGNLIFKSQESVLQTPKRNVSLHSITKWRDCPIIYPIGEKNIQLGRLSGLQFEKHFVWAFVSTGDLIRWRRP